MYGALLILNSSKVMVGANDAKKTDVKTDDHAHAHAHAHAKGEHFFYTIIFKRSEINVSFLHNSCQWYPAYRFLNTVFGNNVKKNSSVISIYCGCVSQIVTVVNII